MSQGLLHGIGELAGSVAALGKQASEQPLSAKYKLHHLHVSLKYLSQYLSSRLRERGFECLFLLIKQRL
jgi:hypothetical protein